MRLASSQYSAVTGISPQVAEFVSRFFLVKDALGRTACGKVAKFKEELLPVDTSEVRIRITVISSHLLTSAKIDVSIGCSYGLIGIISKTTDLARDLVRSDVVFFSPLDTRHFTNFYFIALLSDDQSCIIYANPRN